jgi:hypothetical protein
LSLTAGLSDPPVPVSSRRCALAKDNSCLNCATQSASFVHRKSCEVCRCDASDSGSLSTNLAPLAA